MNKIKFIQVGCGKMSRYTMRYAIEKGYELVGAYDINKNIINKTVNNIFPDVKSDVEILNVDKLTDIKEGCADIAIVTTMSLLNDIKDVSRTLLSKKINVITTCEEAFFSSNSNPTLYKELDVVAKANNVTITGCGYQDVFWGNLIYTLAGSTHRITKIKGSSSYNVEEYGIALADAHGVGLDPEEFDKKIASVDNISDEKRNILINQREFLPSYMWNTVGWLADKFNLHITDIKQRCVPIIAKEDVYSSTLGKEIKAGCSLGMSAIVTADTSEKIRLEAECIGKVYVDDDIDLNEWTIFGEPDTSVIIKKPQTVELTCADIVNRLIDVINSKSGFVPTSQMGTPNYILEK
ncbi:MAG: dihydrodipicolinate reductase [Bacilli bacterium]|nr:dihydrodipicolinate reductase [Bacilli bacterium]